MKLKYNLDISDESVWKTVTPNEIARKLPLYVNEIGHFICGRKHSTEREGQKNYFLIYTVSGCGSLKYKGNEYQIPSGSAAIINCNNYQFYKTSSDIWNYRWVHFSGNSSKIYYELINDNALNVVEINKNDVFEQAHEEIINNIEENHIVSKANAAMLLIRLLTICIDSRLNSSKNANFKHKQEIEKVRSYIAANYYKKITLDDLCSLVYVSKYHFLKVFKTYTGFTPYEYLINYRINIAKQMLKNTDLCINEVSQNVGFKDESSFIKQFKTATGFTPLGYRRFF